MKRRRIPLQPAWCMGPPGSPPHAIPITTDDHKVINQPCRVFTLGELLPRLCCRLSLLYRVAPRRQQP